MMMAALQSLPSEAKLQPRIPTLSKFPKNILGSDPGSCSDDGMGGRLLDQGLYCSLRQLLKEGFFHADSHPGNLVATTGGSLAYFDFGMMGDIPQPFLYWTYSSGIMSQLYDVMYEFGFSLPPDYALVIRALRSLEGTAKVLDPEFKVVESAYSFVIARLLADPNSGTRRILRKLLVHDDGSIRWNRLIATISELPDDSDPDTSDNPPNSAEWKSFNMRAVVSAPEELLDFILSDKVLRVHIFLLRDIGSVMDTFLEEAVGCSSIDELKAKRDTSDVEVSYY